MGSHKTAGSQTIQPYVVSGRIPLLDGLRAVAVLLVILAHGCQMKDFPLRQQLQVFLVEGQIGVDVFFVLSGFLITSLLIREAQRTETIAIGQFFLRRSVRILPAYIAYLLVVFVLERFGNRTLEQSDWIGAVTYTTNFLWTPAWRLGHFWSLSIEEHFYLIWPVLFALLPQRNRWLAPVICILLSTLARTVLYFEFADIAWMANRWTFTRCDAICLGCLLSLVASSTADRFWGRSVLRLVHPFMFVVAIGFSITLSGLSYGYAIIMAPLVHALFIAATIWSCLVRHQTRSVSGLNHRLLKAIGVRSYSIYLWQQLILVPDAESLGGIWLFDLAAVFIVAEASWRLVESPALLMKERFCRQPSSTRNCFREETPQKKKHSHFCCVD